MTSLYSRVTTKCRSIREVSLTKPSKEEREGSRTLLPLELKKEERERR
jgi:hypothetical protein